MDLDANALLASILVGLVGAACFMYGKRQARVPPMVVGALMVVYPYFVPNALLTLAIGGVLLVALWGAVRLGW